MIDVIIPAYNAHSTMIRCLSSIACQTVAKDCHVIIVDDCSDTGYEQEAARFKDFLDIELLKLPKNGGPGVARQYGFDHGKGDYATYIDADDTFAGAYALGRLKGQLDANPNLCACVGAFAEEQPGPNFLTHGQDMVWMFGKMFRRSFLEANHVRFHPTSRANEDNGYNTIVRLISDERNQVGFIPDIVYYWHSTNGSITRANNCQYSYDGSFLGYAENMIYAVETARKLRPFNGQINLWAVEVMCHLYEYYMETLERAPQYAKQNWDACRRYYDAIFRQMRPSLEKKVIAEIYSRVMIAAADKLIGIAPETTIWQFLDALDGKEGIDDQSAD